MAANRRKQDDKNLEILRELITINGNKYCLDCNQRGPTYVNTTIGSFVCSRCSGMLRGLTPPHRVKSISMATFTPEEIVFIKNRGNDYCRRVWLGLYEGESVNFNDEQRVRDFMLDKYEKKRYYLESQLINGTVSNGSGKHKSLSKGGSVANAAPLISLPTPSQRPSSNISSHSTSKVVNLLPLPSQRPAKVVNNVAQPFVNDNVNITPVPDFPVDFSTADIYNCSQASNAVNNNITTLSLTTTPTFNAFSNTPKSSVNDRYAALADLDSAFRQQNMNNMKPEDSIENKNPFQSSTNDLFANKNPFVNGNWNLTPGPVPVNPFMPPATNNGSCVSSKNPFL